MQTMVMQTFSAAEGSDLVLETNSVATHTCEKDYNYTSSLTHTYTHTYIHRYGDFLV